MSNRLPSSAAALVVALPAGVELDEREERAYRYWMASEEAPIAPSTQAGMFQLYLGGKTCEEIRKLNEHFSLGAIVAARVRGGWDAERELHLRTLLSRVRQRTQQVALETVDLLCDLLTAKNKVFRQRVLLFIQSGDEKHLADLKLDGIRGYKDVVEALLKVTGQDPQHRTGGVSLTVNVEAPKPAAAVPQPKERAASLAEMRDRRRALQAAKV